MGKQIEITHAHVIVGNGSDKVYLQTTLPSGIYPFKGSQSAVVDIAHGDGADWCRKHLGIEPEVTKVSS